MSKWILEEKREVIFRKLHYFKLYISRMVKIVTKNFEDDEIDHAAFPTFNWYV